MSDELKYIPRKPKLIVFAPEDRERVLAPSAVQPGRHRGDPTKLKVKKQARQVMSVSAGLGAYSKPGKTARDKAKTPTGKKTNDPTLCQKMKGQKGAK